MASVGGVACTFVKGSIPAALRMKSERWHRAGINGEGVLLLGYGGVETTIRAVLYSSNAGVNAWAALIQALQGTVATVIDDWGSSASLYLQGVGNCEKRTARQPGSLVTCRGEIEIKAVRL
jgi:hypothetical protein